MSGGVRAGGVAAGLVTALLLAGCGGDASEESRNTGSGDTAEQSRDNVAQAVTAAARRTTEVSSAKVTMTVRPPGGSEVRMSGVLGWDPLSMDMRLATDTPKGLSLPDADRLVWVDDTLYLGGADLTRHDGKRWLKVDLGGALAKLGGSSLAGGLDTVNGQDPRQLMTLLRAAPDVTHVGKDEVDGVTAQRYKGTVTVDDVVNADDGLDFLSGSEREDLLKGLKESGMRGYEIEAWVKDDLPVRLHTTVDSPMGEVSVVQKLSDYGTDTKAQAPPADETFDISAFLRELTGPHS